jgi:methionyl-tRNA formyltransferase
VRLVYLGTPAFAVPCLERTVEADHEVLAVFTQPDRPKGRGNQNTMPPVKEAALRLGLTVQQPERIRHPDVVERLRALAPDAMVVVGYGQIIPQSILDIPPRGIINVHASLLPKYRGAAPIQWAIARGESVTGVTTMKIDAGLDTGDMLLKWETPIGAEETAIELGGRLAIGGAELLVETLRDLAGITPQPQNHAEASYAPILKREDGHIQWDLPAREIANRVRGFQPWPGAYGFLRGSRFHVWKARVTDRSLAPGNLRAEKGRLFAGSGEGSLELLEVQLEGKKRLDVRAFLNGFTLQEEETLQ